MIRALKTGIYQLLAVSALVWVVQAGAQTAVGPITAGTSSMGQPYHERGDASMMHNGLQAPIPEDLAKLALAPGFLVGLNVMDEPDLQGSYRVDASGDLDLPVLGSLKVAGMTPPVLARDIRDRLLKGRFLKDPQVTVNVLEYTAPDVTILGEVISPGRYPLLAPHSLTQVLALAGGLNALAGDTVEILPGGDGPKVPVTVHYSKDSGVDEGTTTTIHPGDTIRVQRAGIVYVLGAVIRPGGYLMQEGGTLNILQAISLASGPSPIANTGTIHILRPRDDGSTIDIPLSYSRLVKGKTAPVLLQAKDMVYVPSSKVKAALTSTQALINSTASAAIYAVH